MDQRVFTTAFSDNEDIHLREFSEKTGGGASVESEEGEVCDTGFSTALFREESL